jgi:Family of unknown function (DUF5330)
MKIFRTIILLSGLAVFMPSPPENEATPQSAAFDDAKSSLALLSAATNAVSDLGSFCARQENVCETAQYVAHRLEVKAKYSAKLLYEWANEATVEKQVGLVKNTAMKTDPLQTSGFTVAEMTDASQSQSTLRLEDIIPTWRGPILPKNS